MLEYLRPRPVLPVEGKKLATIRQLPQPRPRLARTVAGGIAGVALGVILGVVERKVYQKGFERQMKELQPQILERLQGLRWFIAEVLMGAPDVGLSEQDLEEYRSIRADCLALDRRPWPTGKGTADVSEELHLAQQTWRVEARFQRWKQKGGVEVD